MNVITPRNSRALFRKLYKTSKIALSDQKPLLYTFRSLLIKGFKQSSSNSDINKTADLLSQGNRVLSILKLATEPGSSENKLLHSVLKMEQLNERYNKRPPNFNRKLKPHQFTIYKEINHEYNKALDML
ncbi:hypothetical protein BB558_003637, partial [Smittium angustum]